MINQAICIDCLDSHLLYPLQCHLNGVHISEALKYFAESPSETMHAIGLVDPFDITHLLIILLQISGATSYFDVYFPSIAKYESKDIPKIYLPAEEPPWDPLTNK